MVRNEVPQLCQLGRKDGIMVGIKVFQYFVADIFEFCGVSVSEMQILETGQLAYGEAYWMNLAELKLFVVRIKTGHYRSHKNLTPALLMEHLADYTAELLFERGQYHATKPTAWQEPPNPVPEQAVQEVFMKLSAQFQEQIDADRAKKQAEADERAAKQREINARYLDYLKKQLEKSGISATGDPTHTEVAENGNFAQETGKETI